MPFAAISKRDDPPAGVTLENAARTRLTRSKEHVAGFAAVFDRWTPGSLGDEPLCTAANRGRDLGGQSKCPCVRTPWPSGNGADGGSSSTAMICVAVNLQPLPAFTHVSVARNRVSTCCPW